MSSDKEDASSSTTEDLDVSIATCPVCFESLEEPRIFTKCGHSICAACEDKISVVDPINRTILIVCPVCRESVDLLEGEKLPTNWALKELFGTKGGTTSSKGQSNAALCGYCDECVPISQLFQCEPCYGNVGDGRLLGLICGGCYLTKHRAHEHELQKAVLVDSNAKITYLQTFSDTVQAMHYRREEIGSIDAKLNTLDIQLIDELADIRASNWLTECEFSVKKKKMGEIMAALEKIINVVQELCTALKKTELLCFLCPEFDGLSRDEFPLYKKDDNDKALTVARNQIKIWKITFHFHVRKVQLELEQTFDLSSSEFTPPFKWFSSNLFAPPPSTKFQIFLADSEEVKDIVLPAERSSISSIDYFAAFLHKGCYAYLDYKATKFHPQKIYSCQLTIGLMKNASFVFGDVVIIIASNRVFRLDTSLHTLHDISSIIKYEDGCSASIFKATQDEEALYVCRSDKKIYKIQVEQIAEKTSEDSHCPICFERYDIPKILTKCGHSICEACETIISVVDVLAQSKTLTCPICRVVTKLNANEVLPTNWSLKNLTTNSGPKSSPSLSCRSCNADVLEGQVFDCSKCSLERRTFEMLMCEAIEKVSNYEKEAKSLIKKINKTRLLTQKGLDEYLKELKTINGKIKKGRDALNKVVITCAELVVS
ncbi:hypothetical protein QR680_004327 [Steinernema hermaphroditum]|uniref:RING-type domain-containing protein n=1 Tax=Steinernema hermaphroditum TaxID=289476 RepID=A0AA39HNB8_9BILA|nr:hypothetical protein QR680_004327 [Steinernema hermaphroditum]